MNKEQEVFWKGKFGDGYAQRNSAFDPGLEETASKRMTTSLVPQGWNSVLECDCNTGRNLATLRRLRPELDLSLIEIKKESCDVAVQTIAPHFSSCGSIVESDLPCGTFDLVFASGVLIHIHPDDLEANCRKMFDYSRKYILIAEYFNQTPVSIDYHREKDKLFKRDFGGFVLDHFSVRCLDYGVLWGREFDAGGFDDATWWLFERKA